MQGFGSFVSSSKRRVAPALGFEPRTIRLTVGRSTTELRGNAGLKTVWVTATA